MIDQDLVDELSAATYLPRAAIARASANPSSVAAPVLSVLDIAANSAKLTEKQENLLFWGIHILGGARDQRVYPPLLRLLRRPRDELGELLGDALGQTMPQVVTSVFDGSPVPLFELLSDREADSYARWPLFYAMAFLAIEGRIPRADATAFLVRFDEERLADAGDPTWNGWVDAIAMLGLKDLADRVRQAYRDERVDESISDLKWFEKALKAPSANPADAEKASGHRLGYIDDVVAVLEWLPAAPEGSNAVGEARAQGFADTRPAWEFQAPARNPMRHVGRNDPCPCGSGKKAKRCCLAT